MHWYSKKLNKKFYYKQVALREDPYVEFRMGDVYDQYDWTIEPEGTWQDVLKAHALKLRDSHEYLRLWYSGGSDSQTILNTFVKNDIHLDEIAMVRFSPINNYESRAMQEINLVAIPQIQQIRAQIPHTKVEVYDLGYSYYVSWFDKHFDLDKTNVPNFRIFFTSNAHKLIPGINNYKNIGNITGVEKPRLSSDEKGTYWYFIDESLANHIVDPHEPAHQIMFFMDPIVHAKQCHIIKNHNDFNGRTIHKPEYFIGKCRDELFLNFSHGKTSIGHNSSPKAQMDIEDALNDVKTKHLVTKWRDGLNSHDLPLTSFNNQDVMLGLVGIPTKKFHLSK